MNILFNYRNPRVIWTKSGNTFSPRTKKNSWTSSRNQFWIFSMASSTITSTFLLLRFLTGTLRTSKQRKNPLWVPILRHGLYEFQLRAPDRKKTPKLIYVLIILNIKHTFWKITFCWPTLSPLFVLRRLYERDVICHVTLWVHFNCIWSWQHFSGTAGTGSTGSLLSQPSEEK